MRAQLASIRSTMDPLFAGAVVGLVVTGAVVLSSASVSLADRNTGEPLYYFVRHLGALGVGALGASLALVIPTEVWHRLHWLLLLAAVTLLALVLVPAFGETVNGARRWLEIGPVGLQASEPARLCLIMYLASYAVRHHEELVGGLVGFAKPMIVVAGTCALLLAEPDYGAAVVVTATSLALLFAAGARLRDFTVAALAACGALGTLALTQAYRLERLTTFLDPWQDPFASGFQLTNSLIAIGRGNWLGVGLGESVQKLFYLPEAHTDFVFAVLAEELGFLGSTGVIVLFGVIVWRAIVTGQRALEAGLPFAGLMSIGIGVMIGLEAFINIGVNTGLLPTKGLALPLVSYGRSSTVVTLVALGLLARVHHELALAPERPGKRGAR